MKKSILLVAAAMLAIMATSCNKETEELTKTPITISANYGGGNAKVSYTEDGNNITATWETGDELIVCWNGHKNTLTLSSGAGTSAATFTGSITGTPTANSTLVCFVKDSKNPGAVTVSDNGDYLYTSDAFLTQDGSMDSAASRNLYYGTCFYGDGTNISCTFKVNTSMMKLIVTAPLGVANGAPDATLTYKSGNAEIAKATFTVGSTAVDTIYLTIPAGHYSGIQTLVYSCSGITETQYLSSSQANFVAGQTYSRNVNFFDDLSTPITFEAKSAGVTITFTPADDNNMPMPIEYSTDGVSWFTYIEPITLADVGDKVMFKGENATYSICEYDDDHDLHIYSSNFSCSGDCFIYGNIMSLVGEYGHISYDMTSENKAAFRSLFRDNPNLYNHPTKNVILPALTLSDYCYSKMFFSCANLTRTPEMWGSYLANYCYEDMFAFCTSLTTPPNLPAQWLSEGCYDNMFCHCTNLTTTPELSSIELAENCYRGMFAECTNLTRAPELPASTLAKACYHGMFSGCTNLTTPPILHATRMYAECYQSMFYNCTSLTTAPDLPATALAEACYQYMFNGCTNLVQAPELPATTLSHNCYAFMFERCSSLTTAPDLPATTVTDWCYNGMFRGCTSRVNGQKVG